MSSSIVVTGASGFIGRAVVDFLVKRDRPVVAISRSKTGFPASVEVVQTADYVHNIPDYDGATCIHLAGIRDKTEALKLGASHDSDAKKITDALLDKKFNRFVFASTSTVYPSHFGRPCCPGDEIEPTDNYAQSKLMNEAQVLQRGGVVTRLSNIYGQGMAQNSVIADILKQIPGTGPLKIRNAKVARDFLWIEDLAEGLVAAADGTAAGVFNLGSGQSERIGQITKIALDIAGESSRAVISTDPNPKASEMRLDLTAMQHHFNWQAGTSLYDGLSRLIHNNNSERNND